MLPFIMPKNAEVRNGVYVNKLGPMGSWYCSKILARGSHVRVSVGKVHPVVYCIIATQGIHVQCLWDTPFQSVNFRLNRENTIVCPKINRGIFSYLVY